MINSTIADSRIDGEFLNKKPCHSRPVREIAEWQRTKIAGIRTPQHSNPSGSGIRTIWCRLEVNNQVWVLNNETTGFYPKLCKLTCGSCGSASLKTEQSRYSNWDRRYSECCDGCQEWHVVVLAKPLSTLVCSNHVSRRYYTELKPRRTVAGTLIREIFILVVAPIWGCPLSFAFISIGRRYELRYCFIVK